MRRASATGIAVTGNGCRYLQQLCRYWSDRFPVRCDECKGTVELASARVSLTATAEALRVELEVNDISNLSRLQKAVSGRLSGVTPREEPLALVWR